MTMQYSVERKKYERELIRNISDNTVYRLRKNFRLCPAAKIPLMYT